MSADRLGVPPGGKEEPGWHRSEHGTIYLRCGNGHLGRLSGHTIDPDGAVHPSCECPKHGCDWHETIRLLQYDEVEP